MKQLNIMQIAHVKLRDEAADILTANAHKEVLLWLEQWTAKANFKAVVSDNETDSLRILTADLQQNLVPCHMLHRVKPHHFTFQVSSQNCDDGRFWMPSSILWGTSHPIPEK